MILKYFFGLSLFLLSACASSQKYQVTNPMLYEIKRDNTHKGYLFGTIHRGVDIGDLPNNFWPIFDSADNVVTEIDLDRATDPEFDFSAIYLRDPNDFAVRNYFEPSRYKKILEVFKSTYGDKAEQILEGISLLAVSDELSKYYFNNQDVKGADKGEVERLDYRFMLDKGLQERAKKNQKIMTYLDQKIVGVIISCFKKNETEQVAYIENLIDGKIQAQDYYDEYISVVRKYRQGNSDFKLDVERRKTTDFDFDKCILDARNEYWMPAITKALEVYDNSFIAVGAAHLNVGEKSLFKLLIDSGYKVERLPANFSKTN